MTGQHPVPRAPRTASRCPYSWCTTAHGRTVHPDDEVHRSSGISFETRVRRPSDSGRGRATTLEVGLVRRDGDDAPWLVIDDGATLSAEIPLDGARALRRLFLDDATLRSALDVGDDEP